MGSSGSRYLTAKYGKYVYLKTICQFKLKKMSVEVLSVSQILGLVVAVIPPAQQQCQENLLLLAIVLWPRLINSGVTPDTVTQVESVVARTKGSPPAEDKMDFLRELLKI